MFAGSLPLAVVQQILSGVDFNDWGAVYVGGSGSFRLDRAVKSAHPALPVHGNDVSLFTCALGALATGAEFPIAFTNRFAFVEPLVEGASFLARVAAVLVVLEMTKYLRPNPYAEAHFVYYRERFAQYHASTLARLTEFVERLDLASFTAGDFRAHARRAAELGGGFLAHPPLTRGAYERTYAALDDSTEWPRPEYGVWNPAALDDWMDELDGLGARYCIVTDHLLKRHEPAAVRRNNTNWPIYTFSDRARTSVRHEIHSTTPFIYQPLDPSTLRPRARVEIRVATSGQMNFLKDIYLAKGIAHASGTFNFLVYVNDALAGGFIHRQDKSGDPDNTYLLSDFALSPKTRVSKLIAMLATAEVAIHLMETRTVERLLTVATTVFTDRPSSMKYRGVFELVSRSPGKLSYASNVRHQTPDAIYVEWFQRFIANARHQGKAGGAQTAGEKRPLHEGRDVQPAGGKPETGRGADVAAAGAAGRRRAGSDLRDAPGSGGDQGGDRGVGRDRGHVAADAPAIRGAATQP